MPDAPIPPPLAESDDLEDFLGLDGKIKKPAGDDE